jgi:hypothetical protein
VEVADDHKLAVYRFQFSKAGQTISPGHMWGTKDAISTLQDCVPIDDSERRVHRKLLDAAGFYYEETASLFQHLDEPEQKAA